MRTTETFYFVLQPLIFTSDRSDFFSDFLSDLGTGVSILSPKQCHVRCTMEQRPRCKECCRAVDGPDPVPKSSGTQASSIFHLKRGLNVGLWRFYRVSITQMLH